MNGEGEDSSVYSYYSLIQCFGEEVSTFKYLEAYICGGETSLSESESHMYEFLLYL